MFDSQTPDVNRGDGPADDPSFSQPPDIRLEISHGIKVRQIEDLELIIVSKQTSGFTAPQSKVVTALMRDIASGQVGSCKFLVFDLAAHGVSRTVRSHDFETVVEDLSNLIFQVPVISIAWVRHGLSGSDLELALACSMVVGEADARLSFDIDIVDNIRSYALLAHKIGFVQAERLMDEGTVLSAAAAHDLMLLHSVAPSADGMEGIRRFVGSRLRRHNSACGLYRAQRIAMLGAH